MDTVYIETSIISHASARPSSDPSTAVLQHIANAHELPRVYQLLDEIGLSGLLIYTPFEFLGGSDDDA